MSNTWKNLKGPKATKFETLRTRVDELLLAVSALAPETSHDACSKLLFHLLRFWNYRSPRIDRHISGEWLFVTHEQLVFYGCATSVRTSKRVLKILEDNGLLARRKAHMGDVKHKLHLAPDTMLLRVLEQIDNDMFRHLNKHAKPRVMRYLCDRTAKCGPGQFDRMTLPYIGRRLRSEQGYGLNKLVGDLEQAMTQAITLYDDKPDPFVNVGLSAKVGPYASTLSANSGTYEPGLVPNLAPTIKGNGYIVNGDNGNGDSGSSKNSLSSGTVFPAKGVVFDDVVMVKPSESSEPELTALQKLKLQKRGKL